MAKLKLLLPLPTAVETMRHLSVISYLFYFYGILTSVLVPMSAFDQVGSAVDLGVIVISFVDLAKPFLLSVSMQEIGEA